MIDFFSNNLLFLALGAGVIATLRDVAVSGGSFRKAHGKKLEVLLQMRVRQAFGTVNFRLLLVGNPRFPQAIRQSGPFIHHLPLPAPVVDQLPGLLRKAVAQSTQFPDEKQVMGRVAHRERSVWGEVVVVATGDSEFPVRLKVKPWVALRPIIAAYRLELHQASNLADLMDHGRTLSEPIDSNHPGTYR